MWSCWSSRLFRKLAPAVAKLPQSPSGMPGSLCGASAFAATAAGFVVLACSAQKCHFLGCDGPSQKEESLVLSADCGGTTTRLRIYRVRPDAAVVEKQEAPGTLIIEQKFPNIMFKSLEDIIEHFLAAHCGRKARPCVAVLAVAGIVTNNQCRFTNLDWIVDGSQLAKRLGIARVEIINDFVAQGYGALTLGDEDLQPLNDVPIRRGAPIACIGAGTGLGQCFLVADPSGDYTCYPSEGGHAEFAPRGQGSNEDQIEMLKYLKIKFSGWNRISVERVVSGKGICNIYEFLAYKSPARVDREMHTEFLHRAEGDASVVAKHAVPGSLCHEAMEIFAECYGSQCGTMAIQMMPFRGLFITGGVSKKLSHFLQDEKGSFRRAYHDKGRVSPLLDQVPLFLVKSDDMGQRGAHLRSVRLLQEYLRGEAPRIDQQEGVGPLALVPPRPGDGSEGPVDVAMFREFQARNRRIIIGPGEEKEHEPVFKSMLWRVNRIGNPMDAEEWIYRETWVSRNGCLSYLRQATQQDEVYFTRADLEQATVSPVGDDEAIKPWSFKVQVPGFEPAYFAADSAVGRDFWLEQLKEVKDARTTQF